MALMVGSVFLERAANESVRGDHVREIRRSLAAGVHQPPGRVAEINTGHRIVNLKLPPEVTFQNDCVTGIQQALAQRFGVYLIDYMRRAHESRQVIFDAGGQLAAQLAEDFVHRVLGVSEREVSRQRHRERQQRHERHAQQQAQGNFTGRIAFGRE
jgi:hypothetical protein